MKKLILVFLAGMMVQLAAAQRVLTLQQCVDTALQRNRNVKQQEIARQARQIDYEQARQNLLPNLNASVGQNYTFGRSLTADNTYQSANSSRSSFSISSSVTLFDGMRMKYNIDARRADVNASEAELAKIRKDIELNVTVAYLQALMYKENELTARNQTALSELKIEQKKILVDAGKVPEGELFELKAQLAREELTLTQASNNYQLALLDLAQIIELEDFKNMDVEIPSALMNSELTLLPEGSNLDLVLQNRPEMKAAGFRLKSNEKNVDIARSALYPSLSMGAQMGTGYYNLQGIANKPFDQQMGDNLSTGVGLSLQIPVFNKFEVKNRISGSKLAVENSKLEMENVRMQLRKNIQQAYQNALAAQSRLKAAQKSEEASREAYRYAEQKYESGRATVYELYQAKTNLAQVISELSQAKYEFALRIKAIELLQ
jgi:outer membrane protein